MIQTRSKRIAEDVPESAIPGVSIPEVRRGLDALRTAWNNAESPFYLSAPLSVDTAEASSTRKRKAAPKEPSPATETMQSFCIKYIMGHHVKRYEKAKQHQR